MTSSPSQPEKLLNLEELRELRDREALATALQALLKAGQKELLETLAGDRQVGSVRGPGEGIYEYSLVPVEVPTLAAAVAQELLLRARRSAAQASTQTTPDTAVHGSTPVDLANALPANCPTRW